MNEQEKQDLATLTSGDWMVIYPHADKKYHVSFRRVDMAKQTLTVHGDFSVSHQVHNINDVTPKVIVQIGERTYPFSEITSWTKQVDPTKKAQVGSFTGLTAEQQAALERWERTGEHTPGVNVFYPNPEDPRTFLQFEDGVLFTQVCPPDMHFNAKLQMCEYPRLLEE